MRNKFIYTATLAALTVTALAPVSLAAPVDSDLEVNVSSGDFLVVAPNLTNTVAVTLSSETQAINLTDNLSEFTVRDNRGTREGWYVTVAATQFTEVTPPAGQPAFVLPEGSLKLSTISDPRVSVDAGAALTAVGITSSTYNIVKHLTTETAIDSVTGTTTKLFSAPVGSGMGEYKFSLPAGSLKLYVDAMNSRVRSTGSTVYSSTVTWNLVNGPGA